MKKNILFTAMKQRLMILFAAVCIAVNMSAETFNGICGPNLSWYLDTNTGVLEITGYGRMYQPVTYWSLYAEDITEIILPTGLETIGAGAFIGTHIRSITIPPMVTDIYMSAFYNCPYLESVILPDSVQFIEHDAFRNCPNLKKVFNCSALELTKGSTENGYVAYYADSVYACPEYTITVDAEHGHIEGGGTYRYGTSVLLGAIPDEGYEFVRWNDGMSCCDWRLECVLGDAHYTAEFIQYTLFLTSWKYWNVAKTYWYNLTDHTTTTEKYQIQRWELMINGFDYAIMSMSESPDTHAPYQEVAWLREDVPTKRVYLLTENGYEKVLYDFAAEKGDTLSSYIDLPFVYKSYLVVDTTYTENNLHYQELTLHVQHEIDGPTIRFEGIRWIEGVGSEVGPIPNYADYLMDGDYGKSLLCVHDILYGLLYHTTEYADCEVWETVEGLNESLAEQIIVENGTITCPVPFRVYNLMGQEVTALNGNLTTGIYIVQMETMSMKVMIP